MNRVYSFALVSFPKNRGNRVARYVAYESHLNNTLSAGLRRRSEYRRLSNYNLLLILLLTFNFHHWKQILIVFTRPDRLATNINSYYRSWIHMTRENERYTSQFRFLSIILITVNEKKTKSLMTKNNRAASRRRTLLYHRYELTIVPPAFVARIGRIDYLNT